MSKEEMSAFERFVVKVFWWGLFIFVGIPALLVVANIVIALFFVLILSSGG